MGLRTLCALVYIVLKRREGLTDRWGGQNSDVSLEVNLAVEWKVRVL